MKINKISILFLLDKVKTNKQGKCPVKCRITFSGKRKPFSTGLFIKPENWFSEEQLAKPSNEENDYINTQMSLIKNKINQAFLFLQVQQNTFNVEDIYLQYKGEKGKSSKTILELFQEHNDKVEKLVGKDYVIGTLWKFRQAKELLKSFLKYQFKKKDFEFADLCLKFLLDYEFFLKTEKNLSQATINKTIQRFRRIVKIAISEGFLEKDPFLMYKVKRVKKEVVYVTPEELFKLENFKFSQLRLKQVKDMFVFCCYTGLAYNEMRKLEQQHIVIGFDGNKWIKMRRDKTQKLISVPLLQQSNNLIKEYFDSSLRFVFPVISNQKFNSYLKEIAEIIGIEKNLTHHIARKTFATTVLLYNDVPMEIVSELLGHSKMSITQEHYGKIVQKKISEHMKILSRKLDNLN
ncbi:site-specific integrase [Flavobacterium agrisoli]|uniref:Site-specific integrase n=1 Tax=Flavobacterium agrisoli TaxID=2793066 RepID=A0A934PMX4_9FLAO|nr:site-specific integrase [Flavobacterium agrisoli]MBK0369800.1 site-specific integrase [Flavobacterium agrisoli]